MLLVSALLFKKQSALTVEITDFPVAARPQWGDALGGGAMPSHAVGLQTDGDRLTTAGDTMAMDALHAGSGTDDWRRGTGGHHTGTARCAGRPQQ